MVAVVGTVGGAIAIVCFGKDKDVVTAAERIFEYCGRTKVDVGIMGRCLVSRRAIEVPNAELADVCDLLADGLREQGQSVTSRP